MKKSILLFLTAGMLPLLPADKTPPKLYQGKIIDYTEDRFTQAEHWPLGNPRKLENCTERRYTIESSTRIFLGQEVNCSGFGQALKFKVVVGQSCVFTVRPPWRLRPEQIGIVSTKKKIYWLTLVKESLRTPE